jgi:tetratricopeptide (TPR) repeat protein
VVARGQSVENQGNPYRLWGDVVRRLALGTELDELSASVLQTVAPDLGDLLQQKLPQPPLLDAQAGQLRLISTITDLFRRQPGWTLLLLEDLQWSGVGLDVLAQLSRLAADMRLLIVASYRSEERPDLPEMLPAVQLLPLERLSDEEMTQLSSAILGDVGEEEEILSLLQRETEGNAFFVVEVIRALAEDAGRLTAVGQNALPDKVFPRGIQNIVQRRLERVPAEATSLLVAAAIAGRELDLRVVGQLVKQIGLPLDLETWLTICAETAVLERYNGQWRFVHDKLRQGVLATVPLPQHQPWHLEIANAIEQAHPYEPAQAATLTYHWHGAGETAKEQHYARIAGEYSQQQYLNAEAVTYISRAYDLTPTDSLQERYDLLLLREQVNNLMGNRQAQQADLDLLAQLADALGGKQISYQQTEAMLRGGNYAEVTSDYAVAIDAAKRVVHLSWETQDARYEAAGYLLWGKALLRQGSYSESLAKLEQALAQAQYISDTQIEADSLRYMGVVAAELGHFSEAKDYYDRAILFYQRLGDRPGEGAILNNLANVWHAQGDFAMAQSYWQNANELYAKIGDREGAVSVLVNLGTVNMDLGNYAAAQQYTEQARIVCREINVPIGECFTLLNLGLIHHYQESNEQATAVSQEALAIAVGMGNRRLEGYALMNVGHALGGQRLVEEATAVYQQANLIWKELAQPNLVIEGEAGLARLLLAQNKPQLALTQLTDALNHLVQGGTFEGTESPLRIYFTCYQVLKANSDPRALDILASAFQRLQAQAERLTDDALRRSFLENVAIHRNICAEYYRLS